MIDFSIDNYCYLICISIYRKFYKPGAAGFFGFWNLKESDFKQSAFVIQIGICDQRIDWMGIRGLKGNLRRLKSCF